MINEFMLGSILNNPGALAGILIAIVVVITAMIILFIKLPAIKSAMEQKRLQKQAKKEEEEKKYQEGKSFDAEVFKGRDQKVDTHQSKKEVDNTIDVLNRKDIKEPAKVQIQKSEAKKQEDAKTKDVIGILQGGRANTSTYRKVDKFEENIKAEEKSTNDAKKKAKSDDVVAILRGKKGG